MTLFQKWAAWLVGLGAGALVLANPDAVYKSAQAVRSLTAGSITDVISARAKQ